MEANDMLKNTSGVPLTARGRRVPVITDSPDLLPERYTDPSMAVCHFAKVVQH